MRLPLGPRNGPDAGCERDVCHLKFLTAVSPAGWALRPTIIGMSVPGVELSAVVLQPWTPVIAAHAIVATAALVLGGFNLLRRKRGDRLHRAVGRTWVIFMFFVSAGSFFIGGIQSYVQPLGIFLHALAAWTIVSLSLGVFFARRRNIPSHRGFMIGTYLGLVGATVGVVAVPSRRVPSYFQAYPEVFTAITLSIIALSVLLIQFLAIVLARRRPEIEVG